MGKSELALKARRLLRIMNRMKDDVTTRDLTQESNLPNYDVGHHMSRLIEAGLVEHTGWKDVDAPNDAKVYAITDAGEKHADEVLGELKQAANVEGVDNAAVHELREEVSQLWRAVENVNDRLDEAEVGMESVEEIENRLDAHQKAIKKLMGGS